MTLLKRTIKNSMQGIGIACTLYLLFGMISDQHNHGSFVLENWLFTKQAIGTILVGIAFSAPTEIYHSNRLPFLLQVLFHLGIGCTVYTIVGFSVGWIPVQLGWKSCALIIFLQAATAFLIWLAYAFYYWKLAKTMNEKIREKEQE
ncbi:MAG: DUF3021 domain-containing protein [Lachnospiraceae bacterium]|nr:DUF3021 domain-containing protein [Lachnospiraceae bacterium]